MNTSKDNCPVESRSDAQGALLACSLLLAGLLGAAFVLDWLVAACANLFFLGVVGGLGVLVIGAFWIWGRWPECRWALVPFAVAIVLLYVADTTPAKPFSRFYYAIEIGMTEADVLRELDRQFPPGGRFKRPFVNRLVGPNHLGFILDRTNGAYDAEIVAVDFADGRVVARKYMSD